MKWFYIRTLFTILLLGVCLLVLNLPGMYNQYIFPLGRLHKAISPGDSYAEVSEKFIDYFTEQRSKRKNAEVELLLGIRREDFQGRAIEETEYTYLYDVGYFGEVHLGVLFDKQRQVSEIYFETD